jgi:hypothetical protein
VEERRGRVGWGRGKGQREVEGHIFEEKEERGSRRRDLKDRLGSQGHLSR